MKKITFLIIFLGWNITSSYSQSCEALFTFDNSDLTVEFTDLSTTTGADVIVNWTWNFDELASSSLQNPTFTFPEPGKFDVILTITTQNGCTSEIEIRVEICQLGIQYILGQCNASGVVPIDITISDIYDSADEISVTVDGQSVTGSPFLIDDLNPVALTLNLPGDGLEHNISAQSIETTNCGEDLVIVTEDCSSDCFLSALDVNYILGSTHVINIGDNFFSPQSVAIDLGDVVRFNWVGDGHSSTSDATSGADSWNSGVIGIGSSFDVSIINPGVHPFYCIPHGNPGGVGMSGEILANCPSGTTLNLNISFRTTVANAQGYNIVIDGGVLAGGPFSYTGTGIQNQAINIPGDNLNHSISIVDVADPSCIISIEYQAPDCNQGGGNPECSIQISSTGLGTCDANNNVISEFEIVGSNSSASFNISIDGGSPQLFNYSGSTTLISIDLPGDGAVHSITATDSADPLCTASTSVTTTNCNLPCLISNLTASPPSGDGSPSGITHRVDVEDFQFNPASISISSGDQVEWVWTGVIEHTSTSDAETGTDSWSSGLLGNGASYLSPVLSEGSHPYYCIPHGGPGGEGMSGTINVLPLCNANNEVSVLVEFDIQGAGSLGYNVLVDGATEGTFVYTGGTVQSVTINVIGDGNAHSIEIVDIESSSCTASTSIITPSCTTTPDPCDIQFTASQVGTCDNVNMVSVELSVTVTNGNQSFNVHADNVLYGNYSYAGTNPTVVLIDVPGDGQAHTIQVTDNVDATCIASTSLTTTDCNLPCLISNLTASPPSGDGSPTGITHRVDVEDFQFNPANISISSGDQVEWVWTGVIEHTSTSDAETGTDSWSSGLLGNGASYLSPVLSEGSHPYYCIPHGGPGGEGMSGIINVTPPCSVGGEVGVLIEFDITGAGNLGFSVLYDSILLGSFEYAIGISQNLSLDLIGDGNEHTIEVIDNEQNTCSASTQITLPSCGSSNECNLSLSMSSMSECNEGNTVSVGISLNSDQVSSSFNLYKDGILIGQSETDATGKYDTIVDILGLGTTSMFYAEFISSTICSDTLVVNISDCGVMCIIENMEVSQEPSVSLVDVEDFTFTPKDLNILIGDTVRFIWVGDIPHTVTSDALAGVDVFNSGLLTKGDTFDLILNDEGLHPYYCIPHGGPGGIGMSGTINVIDTCNGQSIFRRARFDVTDGSPQGYQWYVDGVLNSQDPIPYNNRGGANEFIIEVPADGQLHQITIQDIDSDICAFTQTVETPICDTTCVISDFQVTAGNDIVNIIEVRDFEFFPKDITVNTGETVRFIWTGVIPHTTTSDAFVGTDTWDSGLLEFGATYDLVINEAGEHPYYCIPHGGPGGIGMSGKITALPNCLDGFSKVHLDFNAMNGGTEGFKVFLDGNTISDTLVPYQQLNGPNSFDLYIPGDGSQHILTIQDSKVDFCAFSQMFISPLCTEGCTISGLAYELVTGSRDTVFVRDFDFFPKDITVEIGDTLDFIWIGDVDHTVTSDAIEGNTVFNSGLLGKGDEFSLVIDEEGVHPYYCIPHGGPGGLGMSGTISVADQCENGEVDYRFSFFRNTSSVGYNVLVNDQLALENVSYDPGTEQEFNVALVGDGADYTIKVVDNISNECFDEETILGLDCDDPCFGINAEYEYQIDYSNLSVLYQLLNIDEEVDLLWDFGDGNTSTDLLPVHTYETARSYEVCVNVITQENCSIEYCNKVNLLAEVCEASFNFEIDGLNLSFVNQSVFSDTTKQFVWNFDDGNASFSPDSVDHTFEPGIYEVCLLATSGQCNDLFCQVIDLTDPCLPFQSDFSFAIDPDDDHSVKFINNSEPQSDKWIWGFGDGTTSAIENPEHLYNQSGTYTVCLLSQETEIGCSDAYCLELTVGSSGVSDPYNVEKELHLFPNPINGNSFINIQGINDEDLNNRAVIQLYDVTGMLVSKNNINLSKENKIEIDIQTPGLYLLSLIGYKNNYRGIIIVQ